MVIVCGGGIVGLAIARRLLKKGYKVLVIEKERELGVHASGNNSGVIHSGIYYNPGSLKAKLCIRGNFLLKEYIREKGLPLVERGKVLVCKNEGDLKTLEVLKEKAELNGVKVDVVDERGLKEIEPNAKTYGKALYVHNTANTDPRVVLKSLKEDIENLGGRVLMGAEFLKPVGRNEVLTSVGKFGYDIFINAAGIYADRVAHKFGDGLDYKILPFKGVYWELFGDVDVRGNIYPMPDLNLPFLGVHLTRHPNGRVFVGPNAVLSFGREGKVCFETPEILMGFFNVVRSERRILRYMFRELGKMFFGIKGDVKGLIEGDFKLIGPVKYGIRAQLVNVKTWKMENDFLVIKRDNVIHILNAVSPAFTSSLAFAEYLC
ncbi:MAG: L-2-hydroxyglutarate oxidase [candidate division WOR-3 bacterium]